MDNPEVSEQEARLLLREHKIERDITDPKTCIEIAYAHGILPLTQTTEVIPVTSVPQVRYNAVNE